MTNDSEEEYLTKNDQENYMNICNVIGNTANNNAIIWIYGSLNISNSCLIENTKAMFGFGTSSCTCTIINCTIDYTDKYNTYGSVTVDSNSRPSQSIYQFIWTTYNNRMFL